MNRTTEETKLRVGKYNVWATAEYESGEAPEITKLYFEPPVAAEDLSFTCDVILTQNMTMADFILAYLHYAKLDNQWLEEEIMLEL